MANNLTKNINVKIAPKFISPFEQNMVVLKTIDKSIIKTGLINPSSGSTYQVKRPHQFKTVRTSGGDLTSAAKSDLIAATATANVQNYFSEWVEYGQLEEAIELDQLDQILKPIATKIANDVEVDFNGFMLKNSAHLLGVPTLAVDEWEDVAQVGTFANDVGFGPGTTYAQMTPRSQMELAKAQGQLNAVDGLVDSAWRNAQISGNFGGVTAFASNSLNSYTMGIDDGTGAATLLVDGTPDVTYVTNKDSYQITLTVDGFDGTTGTVPAGTVMSFPGSLLLQQQSKQTAVGINGAGYALTGTVVADASIGAGNQATVTLSCLAVFESGTTGENYTSIASTIADGDIVTIVSGAAGTTNVPNLFYKKDAFGILSVKLPKLHSIDSSIINFDGMSFRVHKFSDGTTNQQLVRFDYLPAYVAYNPMKAGRFFGNA
jgi:hypothetical protein